MKRQKSSDSLDKKTHNDAHTCNINLATAELDAQREHIILKAPCVVTAIDPYYSKDVNRHRIIRKFNVKSDVLKIRDIARKKFMLYVMQQRALEKKEEQKHHTKIYLEIKSFFDFANGFLDSLKVESFNELQDVYKQLHELEGSGVQDELKECVLTQQKLSIEVTDLHRKFIYLLKLIGYFHVKDEAQDILQLTKLTNAGTYMFLENNIIADNITTKDIDDLKEFLKTVVEPYLEQRTHLNPEIWISGYENTRRKLFEFYNQFTKTATLNHVVDIVKRKFNKFYEATYTIDMSIKPPTCLLDRKKGIELEAQQALDDFYKREIKSTTKWRIAGIAPVLLDAIRPRDVEKDPRQETSTAARIEVMHTILMGLLSELDKLNSAFFRPIEQSVRRQVVRDKKESRKVLQKVNRFNNWIAHYKKH